MDSALYKGKRVEPVSTLIETILQQEYVSEDKFDLTPAAEVSRILSTTQHSQTALLRLAQEQGASWILRPRLLRYSGDFLEIELGLMDARSSYEVSDGRATARFSTTEPMSNSLQPAVRRALDQMRSRTLPEGVILEVSSNVVVSKGSNAGYREGQFAYVCRRREMFNAGKIVSVKPDRCEFKVPRSLKAMMPGDVIVVVNHRNPPKLN